MKSHNRAALVAAVTGTILILQCGSAFAARAPRSDSELEKSATHIVTGEVQEVTAKMGKPAVDKAPGLHRDRHYEIKLEVGSIAKGEGIKPGDQITLNTWQVGSRVPPLPGPQGQNWIPAKGDRVIAYLEAKDGDSYELLLPNGIAAHSRPGEPGPELVAAQKHLRAFLTGDVKTLAKTYAPDVRLMPGHEMLKEEYGLAQAGARATGAAVARDKLVPAIGGVMTRTGGFSEETLDKLLKMMTYKPLKIKDGKVVTDSTDPVQTADGKLHFQTESGDVVLKIAPPEGDFLLLQLRQVDGAWMVVAEYID